MIDHKHNNMYYVYEICAENLSITDKYICAY